MITKKNSIDGDKDNYPLMMCFEDYITLTRYKELVKLLFKKYSIEKEW